MKIILLIFALLFAHQSIAVAPYGFKGQDQTATQYSNVLKFKNRSVVKTGGINSLVEDQDNLLYNGGFEATPDLDGWTCIGAGSSFTIESKPVSAAVVISGDKTLAIGCATVGGCTCTQDFPVNQQQIGRSVLLSGIVRTSSDVQGLKLTYRENGADTSITTQNVLNGIPATEAVIGSSATTIGIKLTIPYNSTPTIVRVDEIKMAYGTAVTNQPVLEVQTSRRDFGTSATPITVTGALNQTSGQGIYSYNSSTGVYTVLKDGIFNISASTAASITQTNISINISGQTSARDSSNYDASTASWTGRLTSGQTFSVSLTGSGTSNSVTVSVSAFYTGVAPVYTGRCNDPRACETVFSAKVSATGVVSDENLDWINGNCSVSSTSNYSCNLVSGVFTSDITCSVIPYRDSATSVVANAHMKTSTSSTVAYLTEVNGGLTAYNSGIICQRQGQDYINAKVNQIVGSFKDYVRTPNTTTGKVGFCSAKISATGVISDQLGGCFASCTNATTPVCTFTSNYWKSGSVPNCWAQGSSTDGSTIVPYQDSSFISSSSYGAPFVGQVSGTVASGNRKYFCHGEIQ